MLIKKKNEQKMSSLKKTLTFLLAITIVVLSICIYKQKEEISLMNKQREELINEYIGNHQICWYDAISFVKNNEFSDDSFSFLYNRLEESIQYHKTAGYIRNRLGSNHDKIAFSYLNVKRLYYHYLEELKSYENNVDELANSELYSDLETISVWLWNRNENDETTIYSDTDFKNNVVDDLKSGFVKYYFN